MAAQLGLVNALAVSRDVFYIVTSFEEEEAHISPSRLYQYDHGTWRFNEYGWKIQALSLYRAPGAEKRALCIASAAGDVLFPHDESIHERIVNPDAPLAKGKRLGTISDIIQIGSHLYGYGDGGQVYRRSDAGEWAILDPTLLDDQGDRDLPNKIIMPDGQPLGTRWRMLAAHPEVLDEYTRRVLVSDPNTRIRRLAGTEQRMYAAAPDGRVLFRDGAAFRDVPTDSKKVLVDILVEDDDRVLACGWEGALLYGNDRLGFRQLPCATGDQLFLSMASYGDLVYLASNAMPEGLFATDLTRMEQVGGDLDPPICTSVSSVQAVDDVLWVFCNDDIVRYDGTTWTRIGLPPLTPPPKGRRRG